MRIDPDFTISFPNSLWILSLLSDSLWIHYLFGELSSSWIHYEFLIFFANSLSIHYRFGEFTMDQLFFSRTYFKFTISLVNLLGIHFFSRIHFEFTISFANSLDQILFRVFTLNLLFLSRIHYQFTICSRTHYESINFPRIHFEFTIFFVFTLWIHYLLRQFVTLSVSRLIHYFFRKFSLYLLSLREITMDPISFREFTIYFFMLYDEITTWQLNNN